MTRNRVREQVLSTAVLRRGALWLLNLLGVIPVALWALEVAALVPGSELARAVASSELVVPALLLVSTMLWGLAVISSGLRPSLTTLVVALGVTVFGALTLLLAAASPRAVILLAVIAAAVRVSTALGRALVTSHERDRLDDLLDAVLDGAEQVSLPRRWVLRRLIGRDEQGQANDMSAVMILDRSIAEALDAGADPEPYALARRMGLSPVYRPLWRLLSPVLRRTTPAPAAAPPEAVDVATAWHEAGHAVAGWMLAGSWEPAVVLASADHTIGEGGQTSMVTPVFDSMGATRELRLLDSLVMGWAGRAGEIMLDPDSQGAGHSGDIEMARELVAAHPDLAASIPSDIELLGRARALLEKHSEAVRAVAEHLMAHGHASHRHLVALLGEPVDRAVSPHPSHHHPGRVLV